MDIDKAGSSTFFLLLIIFLAGLSGCQFLEKKPDTLGLSARPLHVSSFRAEDLIGSNSVFVAPISVPQNLALSGSTYHQLQQLLADTVRSSSGLELVNEFAKDELNSINVTADSFLRAKEQAKETQADSILVLNLNRFEPLKGNDRIPEERARIGFTVKLLSLSDDSILWKASYDYHDLALSESLSKARAKQAASSPFLWQSPVELYKTGINMVISKLYKDRREAFTH